MRIINIHLNMDIFLPGEQFCLIGQMCCVQSAKVHIDFVVNTLWFYKYALAMFLQVVVLMH
jgi:hypothetical protein